MRIEFVAVLVLTACQPSNPYPTGPAGSPVGVEWKLAELNGKPAGNGANGQPATLTAVEGREQARAATPAATSSPAPSPWRTTRSSSGRSR